MSVANDIDFLPDFKGKDYRADQLDALLAYGFNQKDLEECRPLFSSKWWDYRFIHIGHSLFLFAHHYGQTAELWRGKFGVNPHAKLDALYHPLWRRRVTRQKSSMTLAPDATRTGWLRAMMFADYYGIPYDKWISFAFEYAFEGKWQRLPQPTMLYTDRLAHYVHERWKEESESLMKLPSDPRYLAVNFTGHVWQLEFQGWLMDQIDKRSNKTRALRNFLCSEPYLSEPLARKRFGNDAVNAALSR